MWTYMMAAARGDRANLMMSSRRRTESESPKYGYNLTRPMYRTTRLGGGTSTTASSSYPYTAAAQYGHGGSITSVLPHSSGAQLFHTYGPHAPPPGAARRRHNSTSGGTHAGGGNDDDCSHLTATTATTIEVEEGGTSLFSPLSPSATLGNDEDANIFSCKETAAAVRASMAARKHIIANHVGDAHTAASAAAALASTTATAAVVSDENGQGCRVALGRRVRALQQRGAAKVSDSDDDSDDESEEEDEEVQAEADYLESIMENGKKMSQDPTKRTKPSALRRTLNALRQRMTKRSRAKPPDWFLERFPSAAQEANKGRKAVGSAATDASEIHGTSVLCNRLSVNPSLQSHYRWLAVVSLAVLYNVIFVVGRSVFWEISHRATPVWYIMDYLCDFIYLLDTLVHMHEGYLDQGLLVRDAYKLRRKYFTTKSWSFDILSMLPTDLAYIWWSPTACSATSLPCAVIVRLNRLLRIPRMWEWFDRTETATSYPNAFRICKVVLAILVLIHWNACVYFAISYMLGFSTDNWVYNINGPRNSTLQRQYIYSFYWSTLTLTTIGETPVPENDSEYLFVVADFLAGVLIFATIVGNIGSMISNMNVARVEFQNRMDGVKQYMAFRKVGHELEARVIRWFAYTWSQSGALDEERVLAALPDKLKAEIAIQVHMDTLKQVRIFHDCEPGLLEALVLKLKLQVFSPGDYICRKGDVGKEMYIVKRGKLSVVADDGETVFATLGAGSVFGEVSVLEIAGNRTGNRRTANVRSLGYSDLFCLAKRDLWETLADYPDARAMLTERGCELLRKDGLLDEQVFADSQRVSDSIESGIEKLEVSVENLNVRLARLLAEYTASQAKLKQRLAKLELNYQLTHSSTAGLTAEPQTRPRSGRLYSLQPKRRPRPRPPAAACSKPSDNKQNTL